MGKGYLIDTNAIIEYLENKLPENASKLIDGLTSIQMSVISRIELLAWNKATVDQMTTLEEFIQASTVLTLSEEIILETIQIRRQHRIKLPDVIIAATALANDLILVSRNTSDFAKISGLTCVNPYDL